MNPMTRAHKGCARLCGAMTRKGTPCERKGVGKGGRCRNHGGMSTGPKTEAGKRSISRHQSLRWAMYRIEAKKR